LYFEWYVKTISNSWMCREFLWLHCRYYLDRIRMEGLYAFHLFPTSLLGLFFDPQDGGNILLWNIGRYLADSTAQLSRRQYSPESLQRGSQISQEYSHLFNFYSEYREEYTVHWNAPPDISIHPVHLPTYLPTYLSIYLSVSVYLSVCLSVRLSIYGSTPLVDLDCFFSFLSLYIVGRIPWTGDQPVARPLPTHRITQTQNTRKQTSIPSVWFEPTIPVFEGARSLWSAWF
jgi:hypothetical protein